MTRAIYLNASGVFKITELENKPEPVFWVEELREGVSHQVYDYVGTAPAWSEYIGDAMYLARYLTHVEKERVLSDFIHNTIPLPVISVAIPTTADIDAMMKVLPSGDHKP